MGYNLLPSHEQFGELLEILKTGLNVTSLNAKKTEYGVRWVQGQSSPQGERVIKLEEEMKVGGDTNITVNVGTNDGVKVHNFFDHVPIFAKRERVTIGNNTFVKVPKYYLKKETLEQGGIIYEYRWISETKHLGYYLPQAFIDPDTNEELDHYFIGAHPGWKDEEGRLRSEYGHIPTTRLTRSEYRSAARKNDGDGNNEDSKYHINDMRVYQDLIVTPMMIEMGTRHAQSILQGFVSGRYSNSDTLLMTETETNSVVVSDATGSEYRVGQTIELGTSRGGGQVARDRIITQIEEDVPNAGETTIHFNGDPVDVEEGHFIYNMAFMCGTTDEITSSLGYYEANDGKYPIVWRGLENPYGGIYEHIDGIKISNWRAYVALNPKDYNDTPSVNGIYDLPYRPVSYLNANSHGYVSELGFDTNYPFVELPTESSGSSSTRFADYYYQNPGDRTVYVGGYWFNGAAAGPFFWALRSSLGHSSVGRGARLCKRP